MNTLIDKVERYCTENGLLVRGGAVLVALSGGADSVCLTWVLKQLQPKWQLRLAAAHLHHGLRGAEADRDLAFSREFCQTLQIPFFEKQEDVAAAATQWGCSTETAGRRIRYAFLQDAARQFAATIKENETDVLIATAHHKNDQAETVLMHLLRGSGSKGLAGIAPKRDNIIRPLLGVMREEIETYVTEQHLAYCTDSTNACNDITRNKVRLELLPQLQREYNPEIVASLCRTAEIMRRQELVWDEQAERFFEYYVDSTTNAICTGVQDLMQQNEMVQYAVLRRMTNMDLQWNHIQAIRKLLENNQTGSHIDLPHNRSAEIAYGKFYIRNAQETRTAFCYTVEPGETCDLQEIGCVVEVQFAEAGETPNPATHIMPYAGQTIQIRSRRPGDTICTGGRRQRVKQMMIDAKIPQNQRDAVPIVQVGDEVVWIYGLRHADTVQSGTKKIKIWIKEK